jgi:predicted transcriptional regulator
LPQRKRRSFEERSLQDLACLPVDRDVPAQLREFLDTRVDSFEKLAVVLALRRAPDASMTVDELQTALGYSRDLLSEIIAELSGRKLVSSSLPEVIMLGPLDAADASNLGELVKLYEQDPALVAGTLADLALTRIRTMAGHSFRPRGRK